MILALRAISVGLGRRGRLGSPLDQFFPFHQALRLETRRLVQPPDCPFVSGCYHLAMTLSQSARVGVLLIDHGSRREEANRQLETLASRLRDFSRGQEFAPLILAAHMELATPSVQEAFSSLAAQGASSIVVLPCFLARGKHVTQDIPRLLAEAARENVGVSYVLSPPLSEHAGFIEVLFEAARRHSSMSTTS